MLLYLEDMMAEERTEHLRNGLNSLLSRRGLGGVAAAALATLWQATDIDAKKKKKKKKKPTTTPAPTPSTTTTQGPCTPEPQATTCTGGKCGTVSNNCGQQVNCGACSGYVLDKAIGGTGTGDGKFRTPVGVAVDRANNLYVADYDNGRIQKLTNDGQHITTWGGAAHRLGLTRGVALDAAGNIFVASESLHKVVRIPVSGGANTEWTDGGPRGIIELPRGIGVDPAGNVWLSDSRHRLLQYTNGGVFQQQIGGVHDPNNPLSFPTYIASNGTLFVANTGHHSIYRSAGSPIGEEGSGEGQFKDPRGVALDGAGNLYVVDSRNKRVQKFNSNGEFVLAITESQAADGFFGSIAGIAVDSLGNVFVTDETRNIIHKFRPRSAERRGVGGKGDRGEVGRETGDGRRKRKDRGRKAKGGGRKGRR